MKEFVIFLIILSISPSLSDEECIEPNRLIFKSPGNVTITAIFDVHEGENCDKPLGKGLEEAAAAIWTVNVLNQQNYLPEMGIGLYIFDSCNNEEEARKSLIQEMVFQNCELRGQSVLGTIAPSTIKRSLGYLTSGLNKTILPIGEVLELPSLLKMTLLLLREMSINTIHRVIGENREVLKESGSFFAGEGICIYDEIVMSDFHAINHEILAPPINDDERMDVNANPTIMIIASANKISIVLRGLTLEMRNRSDIEWYLVPTDASSDIDQEFLPKQSYILSAVIPNISELETFVNHTSDTSDAPFNHKHPTRSPFFLSVSSVILNTVRSYRSDLLNNCINTTNNECPEIVKMPSHHKTDSSKIMKNGEPLSKEEVLDTLTSLKIAPDSEMFLFTVNETSTGEEIAVFQSYDPANSIYSPVLLLIQGTRSKRLVASVDIDDIMKRNVSTSSTPEDNFKIMKRPRASTNEKHPCHDPEGNLSKSCGICLNFVKYLSKVAQEKQTERDEVEVSWRFEAWVGINASIATVGILCAMTILLFIMIRICAGDVLEGNPLLSIILLFAIIVTYCSSLPFSFHTIGSDGDLTTAAIICDLRVLAPPLTYSIVFAIMLSRSIMLAACDQDGGFMSHVNGYLQAVIIFFAILVQVVISGEYWYFNSFLLNPAPTCQSMYEGHKFLVLLGYDVFLLVILLAVIPFMCRSKRNYHEGMFFSIAVFVLLLVWCTWLCLYNLLPTEFTDAIVTLGLTASATTILVSIFIPRTYLMTTSIVRDRIVNTLPPLVHSDVTFRSTQALYDSINIGKVGTSNPNFYSMNPSDSIPATPQIQPGHYYSSDVGLKIPSPKKENSVAYGSAHTETCEHTYEKFDGAASNPLNVTRF